MKMHPADAAWAGIIVYEVLCPRDEMLCHAVDRAARRHRIVTRMAIAYVALHAADLLDPRVDAFQQVSRLLRRDDTSPRVSLETLIHALTRRSDCSLGSVRFSGSNRVL